MQIDSDDRLLEKCRLLIEDKLGWGSGTIWTHKDFETLSERVEESTGVRLSAATLKRLWGKVKYSSKPTTTTLDTLAQFVEVENWRMFKLLHSQNDNGGHGFRSTGTNTDDENSGAAKENSQEEIPFPRKKIFNSNLNKTAKFATAALSLVILLSLFLYFKQKDLSHEEKASPAANLYSFESKKMISAGIPNSVIFNYDASAAPDGAEIFIQQSWDERLRDKVSREEHLHTSIYYYPGYFLAKLVVDGQIVKEHPIYIKTKDWLPAVEQPGVPVYFTQDDVLGDGMMSLSVEKLKENSIALQPETPWVSFFNMGNFGDLACNNFILETELKNDYGEGAGVCQLTEIHIRLEGGLFMIPLSIKGCVSSLQLMDIGGVKSDPSKLGVDFSDWVNVRLEVRDGKGSLFINGEKAYDMNLVRSPIKIAGLQFRFQGTGSVNFVRMSSVDGELIYEDNF